MAEPWEKHEHDFADRMLGRATNMEIARALNRSPSDVIYYLNNVTRLGRPWTPPPPPQEKRAVAERANARFVEKQEEAALKIARRYGIKDVETALALVWRDNPPKPKHLGEAA